MSTYGSYLKIPELLALQQTTSDPPERDEVLFITMHQVYELWFKQLLLELDAVRETLVVGKVLGALKSLKRIHTIQRVLVQQIDVMETMTPADFNSFRPLLKSASGFQSVQFRCVEFASGGGNPAMIEHLADDPAVHELKRRLGELSLYEALLTFLWRQGRDVPAELLRPGGTRRPRDSDPRVVALFREVYEPTTPTGADYEAYMLLEAMVEYDQRWLVWRGRHVRMVERTIGMKRGTGGSSGAAYLRTTLDSAFFPELWDVRTVLGT